MTKIHICCCSGEGVISGEVVALAVKLIPHQTPQAMASVAQEVEALKAVRGKSHIVQYVQHTFSSDRIIAVLTTRWVRALPSPAFFPQTQAPIVQPRTCCVIVGHTIVLCTVCTAVALPRLAGAHRHGFTSMVALVGIKTTRCRDADSTCSGHPAFKPFALPHAAIQRHTDIKNKGITATPAGRANRR